LEITHPAARETFKGHKTWRRRVKRSKEKDQGSLVQANKKTRGERRGLLSPAILWEKGGYLAKKQALVKGISRWMG